MRGAAGRGVQDGCSQDGRFRMVAFRMAVIRVALVESFWFASLTLVVLTARTIEMCITVDWPLRSHRTFLVL